MSGSQSDLGIGTFRPTRLITNAFSAGGTFGGANCALARQLLSGLLTAGTLKTMLTVNGGGEFHFLGAFNADTTVARTIRLKVTLDGVVVLDATTSTIPTGGISQNAGVLATGSSISGTNFCNPGPPIYFATSAVVEIASSNSENDKIGLAYLLHGT